MDASRKLGCLMKVISSAYDATKNALLEQYDLTSRQVDLLGFLMERRQHEATQKEITDYLHTSCATTSGVVKRLAEKGFIVRATSEDDRRSNVIRLTDDSIPVIETCVGQFKDIDKLLMAGLTESEQEQLMDLLERLLANAESARSTRAR